MQNQYAVLEINLPSGSSTSRYVRYEMRGFVDLALSLPAGMYSGVVLNQSMGFI